MKNYTLVLVFLSSLSLSGCWVGGGHWWYEFKYSNMTFEGSSLGELHEFTSGSLDQEGQVAEIYVKFLDGSVHYLPELKESVAEEYIKPSKPSQLTDFDPSAPDFTLVSKGSVSFYYRDGRLWMVESKCDLRVGRSADSPFVNSLFNRDKLVAEFGKPVEIEKSWIDLSR